MEKLKSIAEPVGRELETFNSAFKEALRGHNTEFQAMIDFIAGQNGKKIRPLLTLLSAKLCGDVNHKTIDYALIIELLHTTTLIHDDVVDNTLERRSKPSVNAKYDNRAAVLLGDYILALAISRAVLAQNIDIIAIIAEVAKHLADGELTQLISSRRLILDETRYFSVVRNKTAVLLAACGEMGAISAGATGAIKEKMRLICENLGICFQLRDDIFDYYDQGEIGKPVGNDIRECKITLPLLYAIKTAPKNAVDSALSIIGKQDFTVENINSLTDFAKQYGGIEYTNAKMQEIRVKTLSLIDEFPDSDSKNAMVELLDFIIERQR